MNHPTRFKDRTVLVTGAGRGIGRAIAEAFAEEGARVLVSARTRERGQAVVDGIRATGGEAVLAVGDVGVREDVRAAVAAALVAFGGLDVVVHCAADAALGKVADMDEAAFDQQIRANVHSLFWLARDALPALGQAADKGRLIYISSGAANRSFTPGLVPYMASKAYMNAFARGLANEVGHQGVLVNVVEPGLIASDRMREHLPDDYSTKIARAFPVPRPGQPSEIAAAVLFLASKDAGYITGTTLLVDGGATMAPIAGIEDKF